MPAAISTGASATITPELAYDDGDAIVGSELPAPEDALMPEDCLATAPDFLSLPNDLVQEALELSDKTPTHEPAAENWAALKAQDEFTRSHAQSLLYRWWKRIPPYVWIRNMSEHPIQVVVSRSGPKSRLTSFGLGASGTGGNVELGLEHFAPLATTKILYPPSISKEGATGQFPLDTTREPVAIVSIYSEDGKVIIGNDRLDAGSLGCYNERRADLVKFDYSGKLILVSHPMAPGDWSEAHHGL